MSVATPIWRTDKSPLFTFLGGYLDERPRFGSATMGHEASSGLPSLTKSALNPIRMLHAPFPQWGSEDRHHLCTILGRRGATTYLTVKHRAELLALPAPMLLLKMEAHSIDRGFPTFAARRIRPLLPPSCSSPRGIPATHSVGTSSSLTLPSLTTDLG